MKTLGDMAKSFYKNYIAPTKDDLKKGRKELNIQYPPNAPPENVQGRIGTKQLSVAKCQSTAEQLPLFMKAARKKSRDSIRSWFLLETYDRKSKPVSVDVEILRNFEKRTQFKAKIEQAREASFVSGNGYLLITFDKDDVVKIEDAPAENAVPWEVAVLDSSKITGLEYYNEYYKKRKVLHFHYQDNETGDDYFIHPDRILHIPNDPQPGKRLGRSKVNLLRNVIKSTVNIDIACGEILSWFAHGNYDIKEEGLNENRRKFWEKICKLHPGAFIHDERTDITAVDPKAIDPKPFYDYMVLKIAGGFMMPMHVLTGIQVGKVTGAEVGMGDYVKDVKDDQDFVLTPLIERFYVKLLKAHGRAWKYDLVWNPIYIDELAEAEIMHKRVEAATLAMNGQRGAGGFINQVEARRIFNDGQIELEAENVPKDIPKPQVTPPNEKVKDSDDKDDEDENNAYKEQLDAVELAMIKKRKLQAFKEKELGEKILKEQDDNNKSSD